MPQLKDWFEEETIDEYFERTAKEIEEYLREGHSEIELDQ